MKKSILALFSIIILSCSPTIFKKKWTEEIAPESYTTRFETNKGNFDLKVTRSLSPKAADRFYQLVKHSYFDDVLFYRVNPGFVVQFGSSDSIKRQAWDNVKVPDEKTVQSNTRGTLSFARGGKDTRSTGSVYQFRRKQQAGHPLLSRRNGISLFWRSDTRNVRRRIFIFRIFGCSNARF